MENHEEEETAAADLLKNRFRLSTISIAQSEAKQNKMEISEPIVACISDLAFKYAEHVAKDLELFAAHGGRKTVNMKDVILCAHRNEHLADLLRSFSNDLKDKEPQSEKKRKKKSRKDDNATSSDLLRSFSNDLKDKEPQSEKKRKKKSRKDDNATSSVLHIPDDT